MEPHFDEESLAQISRMVIYATSAMLDGRPKTSVHRALLEKGLTPEEAKIVMEEAEQSRKVAIRQNGIRFILLGSGMVIVSVGIFLIMGWHSGNLPRRWRSLGSIGVLGIVGGLMVVWGLSQVIDT